MLFCCAGYSGNRLLHCQLTVSHSLDGEGVDRSAKTGPSVD